MLFAYYPGMEGGQAIADILFGEANPSGKLPFAIPFGEEGLPSVKWDTDRQFYEYYHGYARLKKKVGARLILMGLDSAIRSSRFRGPWWM